MERLEGKSIIGREVYHHIDADEWNRFRSHFIQKILSDDDRRLLSFMLESMGSVSPLIAASDKGFLSRLKELVGNITINPVSSKGYFALPDVKNLLFLLKAQEEEGFLYITYKGEKRKLYPLKCFISAGGVYCYVMMENGFVYKISVPRIEELRSLNSALIRGGLKKRRTGQIPLQLRKGMIAISSQSEHVVHIGLNVGFFLWGLLQK